MSAPEKQATLPIAACTSCHWFGTRSKPDPAEPVPPKGPRTLEAWC
jgi:hypothetical protein